MFLEKIKFDSMTIKLDCRYDSSTLHCIVIKFQKERSMLYFESNYTKQKIDDDVSVLYINAELSLLRLSWISSFFYPSKRKYCLPEKAGKNNN